MKEFIGSFLWSALVLYGCAASLTQADVVGYCCDKEIVLGGGAGIDRCFDCAKFMGGAPFDYRGRLQHGIACGAIYVGTPKGSSDAKGLRQAICRELKQKNTLCPAVAASCGDDKQTTFTDQSGKESGKKDKTPDKPPEECDDFYPPPTLCPPPKQLCKEAIEEREGELKKLKQKTPEDRSPKEKLRLHCLEVGLQTLRECCNADPCDGARKLEAEIKRRKENENASDEDLQHLKDWLEELRKDCNEAQKNDETS